MIPTLSAALSEQGYDTLTPVQEAVTDETLEGRDLLVSAQTGSGKTVGFGLAIGPTILDDQGMFPQAAAPLALVIAPTRELAMQVKRELGWLYKHAGVVMASCVGGMDFRDERRALERGAHIVVATPGRLRDHIMRGTLDMSAIRAVVLDEADEMLDLGFREDLEFILDAAPEERRTLMFSATVPRTIAELAKTYQRDAERVVTQSRNDQHADITYLAVQVSEAEADAGIINLLRYHDAPNAIVFCNTRASVTRLTTRLTNRGFATVALSGELSQQERTHALQALRDGRARVCVATDVAARGIDLPNLELVIHAELPTNPETLVHRSGRTGRAGRKGISAMIATPKFRKRAQNLLKWGKLNAEWTVPPTAEEVTARDEERLLADPIWSEEFTEAEQEFAKRLIEAHDPAQIAAAYLRLYAGSRSAPEEVSAFDASQIPAERPKKERKERPPFGPSRWFQLDLGRESKAEARWLLPMICKAGDITKNEIGAIRIQDDRTFVEIAEAAVPGFLDALGPEMSLENQATLTAVDGTPDLSAPPREGKPAWKFEEKGDRPDRKDKPRGEKPDWKNKPRGDKPEWKDKPRGDKPDWKSKPKGDKPDWKDKPKGDKPEWKAKPKGDKPDWKSKPKGDKPDWKSKPKGDKPDWKSKPKGDKPEWKDKPKGDKPRWKDKGDGGKPAGKPRPKADARDTSSRFVPPGGKPSARPVRGKGGETNPRRGGPKGSRG